MSAGLALALAHLRAFEDNTPEVFARQLTPDFRYAYLPPVLGAGAAVARRWCALLHGLYGTWRHSVIDASETEDEIIVRVEWGAIEPAHPDLAAVFADTAVFKFTTSRGLLASCDAVYSDFDPSALKPASLTPPVGKRASGLETVLMHLRAYEDRTPELFDAHVGAGFRYSHLPPILGAGPVHARRWYDLLHSIYRKWKLSIVDAGEMDGDIIVRTEWRASDPVDPDSAPVFLDSCALRYTVADGVLMSCDAVCLDFEEVAAESAA